MRMHNPPHPGELLKEYIDGVSVTKVAQKLGVSRVTLSRILNGNRLRQRRFIWWANFRRTV
ncbi:helix-turn-helix domain-containing protein [Aggregatibacter actinomycetemcomitans]|nr:helix-turn-helix domain-containing protein [Aggregatibacter actinomycetemcomitans]